MESNETRLRWVTYSQLPNDLESGTFAECLKTLKRVRVSVDFERFVQTFGGNCNNDISCRLGLFTERSNSIFGRKVFNHTVREC